MAGEHLSFIVKFIMNLKSIVFSFPNDGYNIALIEMTAGFVINSSAHLNSHYLKRYWNLPPLHLHNRIVFGLTVVLLHT